MSTKKKIKARWENGVLMFPHYDVKKESSTFVGVYLEGKLVTSAETLPAACKKAKLLELGFAAGYREAEIFWREEIRRRY